MQGDIEEALRLTNQLLEIVPLHQNALSNKTHYEDLLAEMKKQKEGINETTSAAAGARYTFCAASYKFIQTVRVNKKSIMKFLILF